MNKRTSWAFLISFILALAGCGGGSSGGTTTTTTTTAAATTISGKVTLSVVASKPSDRLQKAASLPRGKPGSQLHKASKVLVDSGINLPGFAAGDVVSSATVWLYDSSHPEYLYPVAESATDSVGNYTLSVLANAANNNDGYTDGDPIPEGKYTLMAYKPGGFDFILGVTTEPVVAVQTIVNAFAGDIIGSDLTAQPSDVLPTVRTMFGVRKNTDGTNTWGSASLNLAPNAAIQVNFSMAMSRGSILNGVTISPTVDGFWAISSDWLSATFYLNSGVTLASDTTYIVTVNGSDSSGTAVANVYGNTLAVTAVGTFTVPAGAVADTVAPSAKISSPDTNSGVDVITPIRIASNEVLDVNGLLLVSDPSLGAQPGVMFIGEDETAADQYKYIYEFVLSNPLDLGKTYTINVSGGKDLAGNVMAPLEYQFGTSSTSAGIDPTASTEVQTAQAAVKDVFGKWIRSMNDYNLAQLQSLMTGDFVMEYDTAREGVDEEDKNADGRYSLKEFSDMIGGAFTNWDYCNTDITGAIPGSIVVAGDVADFSFTLEFISANTSQECKEGGPENEMFAQLVNVNGAWVISRIGDGIDIRDKTLVVRDIIEPLSPLHGSTVDPAPSRTNGIVSSPITFSWKPLDNVASYVLVVMNTREPDEMGRAFATSNTPNATDSSGNDIYELQLPLDRDSNGDSVIPFGVENVSSLFNFNTNDGTGLAKGGEEFVWVVFGLGTNTLNDFENSRSSNLFRDIVGISKLSRFQNAGIRKELGFSVTDTAGTPLPFSEFIDGYNAGNLAEVDITITSPNAVNGIGDGSCGPPNTMGMMDSARLFVSGNSQQEYTLNFDATGSATCTVKLNQGFNWVDIWDGVDLGWGFTIQTTGGIAPVIAITSVTDQDLNVLTMDSWGFVEGTGVTSVIINGSIIPNVDDPNSSNITEVNVNVWNDTLQANSFGQTMVSNNTFSVTVDVYLGENWININDNMWFYSANMGIYTDTGTTYVPPIEITSVADAALTENYGNSANWDATADADDVVTIIGTMATPDTNAFVHYRFYSQGGYEEGTLNFDVNGGFTLDITLYNGWNGVDLEDGNGAWYGLQIFTANGKAVPRPTITTIDGTTVTMDSYGMLILPNGAWETAACSVTVVGTSGLGADSTVRASWNAFVNDPNDLFGGQSYWDEQKLVTDSSDMFTVTLPVISGSDNFIDINNDQWVWIGFPVRTSNTTCTYTPPTMTVDTLTDDQNAALQPDPFDTMGTLTAGNSTTVTFAGTHSNPGRTVVAQSWVCGTSVEIPTVVDVNGDWSVTVAAYDGWNNVDITDGPNWDTFSFTATNGNLPPPPPIRVTSLAFYDGLDGAGALLTQNPVMDPSDPNFVAGAGANLNWQGCDFQSWMADMAKSVVVTGISDQGADSNGNYYAGSDVGEFAIASDGSFSVTFNLFDGNNFIGLNDPQWNNYGLDITTMNGLQAPQFVYIQSPLHGDTLTTGTTSITVTGYVDLTQFNPNELWANVNVMDPNDPMAGQFLFYHSNPIGTDQPLTFNSDGTFSFVITGLTDTASVSIRVESCSGPACHGHEVWVNDSFAPPEMHWKAGPGDSEQRPSAGRKIDQVKKTLSISKGL